MIEISRYQVHVPLPYRNSNQTILKTLRKGQGERHINIQSDKLNLNECIFPMHERTTNDVTTLKGQFITFMIIYIGMH